MIQVIANLLLNFIVYVYIHILPDFASVDCTRLLFYYDLFLKLWITLPLTLPLIQTSQLLNED